MNTTSLFYRSPRRWPLACAFVAATGFHLVAVAIAAGYSRPIPTLQACPFDQAIDAETEIPAAPQPIEPQVPRPPSDPSDAEEEIVAPVMRRTPVIARIARRQSAAPANSLSAKAFALSAPRPAYPYEARRQHITGSGVALLRIDASTGLVAAVTMVESTGSSVLDAAAISGLRQWRFPVGTPATVRVPITFTLTGVSY